MIAVGSRLFSWFGCGPLLRGRRRHDCVGEQMPGMEEFFKFSTQNLLQECIPQLFTVCASDSWPGCVAPIFRPSRQLTGQTGRAPEPCHMPAQIFRAAPRQSVQAVYHRYNAAAYSFVSQLQPRGTDDSPLSR